MLPKTFQRLRTPCALVVALLALALPPAALAAEAEAPSSGSGWVGQEGAGGAAGDGSSEVQQGSSLGSGAGSAPAPEPEPQPVESSPPPVSEPVVPEPVTAEAEPTTTTTAPAETSSEVAAAPVAPVVEKPDPSSELAGGTAPVGSAVLGASAASSTPPLAAPASPAAGDSGSDSGGLNLYSPGVSLAIVLGFVLVGLAGRFALHRWRRRKTYNREAAEWRAAVRRLDPEQPKLTVLPSVGDEAGRRPAAPADSPPAKVG
jgi:hypothetical protein